MESEVKAHAHPKSGVIYHGQRLEPGDILRENDVYSSSDGDWQPCPCPGLTFCAGLDVIWVR